MAKKPVKKGTPPPAPKKKSKGMTPAGVLVVVLSVSVLILPTVIVLFVGMLPTVVALFTGREGQRYRWVCVGGLNLAGVAPYLTELWFTQHTFGMAFAQIFNVFNLVVMYFAASVGYALFVSLPPIIGIFVNLAAKQKVGQLRGQLRQLVETWGEEVSR